ncbi:MAG: flavin reductase family protein [Theionarchaea archaeon]|nr:flavin reductase family protein [Theionarchaea archaeon]
MAKMDVELDNFRSHIGQKLLLLGQLVIITTVDKNGCVNAALKSDIMRMVSNPPILAFSCNLAHHTAQNILENHEFVVNVVGEDIVEQAMETAKDYPQEINELEKAQFQALPSRAVKPPRIAECPVNLECKEEWHKLYDDEIIIFGRVMAASIDEEVFKARIEDRFKMTRPMALLGEYRYCPVNNIKRLP